MRSLCCMWIGLVAIKVWIRPLLAPLSASAARSISASRARDRLHTVLSLMLSAIALTAAKSPGLAMAKPASITSTRKRSGALLAVTQGGIKNKDAVVAAHAGVLAESR